MRPGALVGAGLLGLLATTALPTPFQTRAQAATAPAWTSLPLPTAPGRAALAASAFGATIVNFDYTGWGPAAEGMWPSVSLGYDRIWDDQSTWARVEPSPGSWQFALLDQQVNEANSHGSRVLYVLGNTPSWASSNPAAPGPYGLGESAPPADMSTWQTYLTTVAQRYKGRIAAYEVWDEADLTTFAGTPAQMAAMAKVAYTTIKSIDPAATVLTPSFSQLSINSGWLAQYLAAGGAAYADAFVGHAYGSTPENTAGWVGKYEAVLNGAGVHLPIWLDEFGYQAEAAGVDFYTAAQAQDMVARTVLDVAETGVASLGWYGANTNGEWLSLGEQGYPGDAVAYTTTVGWLSGTTPLGCTTAGSGTYSGLTECFLRAANGSVHTVAYDAAGSLSVSAPAGHHLVVTDPNGHTTTYSGSTTLSVGAAPLLVSVS